MAIVVGVDSSPESKEALRWALEEARLRQTTIRAVCVWRAPVPFSPELVPLSGAPMYEPISRDSANEVRRATEKRLEAVVAEARHDVPAAEAVRVEQHVVEGHAAEVLVEAARDDDLLVVGSRGHGGFAGLLLGSVSQACAHHAHCPVVIVRSQPDRVGARAE